MVDMKPEIPRKPKKMLPPETNGTAATTTNGKHPAAKELDTVASLKRARRDDADSDIPAKKAKTSGGPPTTDGDVVVVDDPSGGVIIVDDD